MPRVTAIIPTFNWSGVLPYSIGSVLGQTFEDLELLVIGDGCTDDSEAVVRSIRDSRVRWINLPENSGHQSAPNNEGLRQARGEVIAYLGHDDLWLPHHLITLLAALDAGADMSYGVIEMVRPDGTRPGLAPARFDGYSPAMGIPPTGVIHRRQAARDAGGWPLFDEVKCDPDQALWERMHASGCKIVFVPRLTSVKFPGAWRKNVYRIRAVHEQAAWTKRIASETDIEIVELVKILGSYVYCPPVGKPFKQVFREFGRDLRGRVRRRLLGPPRPPLPKTGIQLFNERREFKGLAPKANPARK